MRKPPKKKKHTKAIDETTKLPNKQGNGILKYSLSVDEKGKVTRYSFAYINHHICRVDNYRVLGYDNCHGYHHRHYMGKEEDIKFTTFENILELFEKEWGEIHDKLKKTR